MPAELNSDRPTHQSNTTIGSGPAWRCLSGLAGALFMALTLLMSGCQTPKQTFVAPADAGIDRTITLREGDVIKVTFTGSPTLNTTQQIRRDGNVNLALVGDIKASGITPSELEKEILKVYGDQLLSKEVTVTLETSVFSVFVTGAVLRPGKIQSDRPITVLEAIMEAGGFDHSKANLKSVRVIRREGERMKTFTLNLKPALEGGTTPPFFLRPSDIVHVPERFSFF